MAKVQGPLHSTIASGKCGSQVYNRNQYGFYVWTPPIYVDPATESQISWREAFEWCSHAWTNEGGMNQRNRDLWNNFALLYPRSDRFGKTIRSSGRNEFIRTNIYRRIAGLGFHAAPPRHPSCRINPSVTFTQESDGIYATLDPVLGGDDLFYCSRWINQSIYRHFMNRNQETAGMFKSTSSHPFLVCPNSLLEEGTHRHFFKYLFVDGDGRPSPHQIDYIDAAPSPPATIWPITSNAKLELSSPDTNYSTSIDGAAWKDVELDLTRTIVFCDFSSITPHAAPASAKLWLRQYSKSGSPSVSVHKILNECIFSEATWNSRMTGTPWGSPGGQSGVDYASTPDDIVLMGSINTWYSFDITSSVTSWFDETSENYGLILIDNASDTGSWWRSSNYSDPGFRPYIEITW